jgi:hypothetical protein
MPANGPTAFGPGLPKARRRSCNTASHGISSVAGVTFWNIYFKLIKGAVRAPEIVTFLKNLRRHLAPASSSSFGIVCKRIGAAWCVITSRPKATKLSWSSCRLTRQNSIPSGTCGRVGSSMRCQRLRRTQRLRARQAQTHPASQNARCSLLEASRIALLMLLCLSKINSRYLRPRTLAGLVRR